MMTIIVRSISEAMRCIFSLRGLVDCVDLVEAPVLVGEDGPDKTSQE